MDSRSEETCKPTDELKLLPPETLLHIFSFLNTTEVRKMQQTDSFYNTFLDDSLFWHTKHNQAYPQTPFNNDAKNQYHAAFLFHHAKATTTPDKQQIGMLKLNRFIKNNYQPWTNYYKGLMHFQGYGAKRNTETGFMHLMNGLDNEDHRAAIKIAQILVETRFEDRQQFNIYLNLLHPERLSLIHQLLMNIHDPRVENVHKLLARLYAHGIGVTADFAQAEKYHLTTLKNPPQDLGELARLKFDTLSYTLDYEQKAERVIEYLESLRYRVPGEPLGWIINYWTAYLELTRGNEDEAIRLLQTTPGFTNATLMLNAILAEHQQNMIMPLRLVDLIELQLINEDTTNELFDMLLIFSEPHEAVKKIRDITNCDMIVLAEKMSSLYRDQMTLASLAEHSYAVWWVQLAAQAGCMESLEALQSLNPENYPFIAIALGIIYEFGILNSTNIEANHDKAEYYFNLARNSNYLGEYKIAGVDNNFACQDVVDLLESKLNPSPSPRL